ncbi:MAG: hypothetical protein JO023_17055 [Chloroflexi bacterium]|nr:hypothetical protein [Chloroflexota bacterium]
MDDLERLMANFCAPDDGASVQRKLNLLLELDRYHDPRTVPFLTDGLTDPDEAVEVRIECARRLRRGRLTDADRPWVAEALVDVLAQTEHDHLRLEAVLTLGDFTDILCVQTALGTLALRLSEPVDVRYTAFTSVERSGPTPLTVQLFRQLAADETLGPSARSVLRLWRVV